MAGSSVMASSDELVVGVNAVKEKNVINENNEGDTHTTPELEFAFILDEWQQIAINSVDKYESVLVAAHTSAGKTVVAMYAVAQALNQGKRVIFTAPVKALSNQKYCELKQRFANEDGVADVGLLTGDTSVNPTARCLVMTTEILRSMLYRGADELNEVSWVIFDEIHYMRDEERGVVWEESIVLLPMHIKMVFLSATLLNADQFADWITHLRSAKCNVVQTARRPTPLHHYVYVNGYGDGLYLVADTENQFDRNNFYMGLSRAAAKKSELRGRSGRNDIERLVSMLISQTYEPAIIFSFSRQQVENHANLLGDLDLLDTDEKACVKDIFEKAVLSLSAQDQNLPQILHILPMLMRGVGCHHSGLLPIIKEIVELLFSESLIKILFATETFSIGVNMPAKTVVFTATEKYDGHCMRSLLTSEYIQMSGRAGRRNTDTFGLSIVMIDMTGTGDNTALANEFEKMLIGDTIPLISRFRLSYSMLLNIMRCNQNIACESLLEKSFCNFVDMQTRSQVTTQANSLAKSLQEKIVCFDETFPVKYAEIDRVFSLYSLLDDTRARLRAIMMKPDNCLRFITPGRIVYIGAERNASTPSVFAKVPENASKDIDEKFVDAFYSKVSEFFATSKTRLEGEFGWGVVLDAFMEFSPNRYAVDVLVRYTRSGNTPVPGDSEAGVVRIALEMVEEVSAMRAYIPEDLLDSRACVSVMNQVDVLCSVSDIPMLNIVDDVVRNGCGAAEAKTLMLRLGDLRTRIEQAPLINAENAWREYARMFVVNTHLKRAQDARKGTALEKFRSELQSRTLLLQHLNYIDENNIVLQKGQLACEIESLDEIVTTELIFDGVLNKLSPAQTAALVSCMYDVRCKNPPPNPTVLHEPIASMMAKAQLVINESKECGVPIDEKNYMATFTGSLAHVVLLWCEGSSFIEICASTTVFEGSIIRNLRRLEYVLVQLAAATKQIGDMMLHEKFTAARKLLHRGVPFAASLYIED